MNASNNEIECLSKDICIKVSRNKHMSLVMRKSPLYLADYNKGRNLLKQTRPFSFNV